MLLRPPLNPTQCTVPDQHKVKGQEPHGAEERNSSLPQRGSLCGFRAQQFNLTISKGANACNETLAGSLETGSHVRIL
ncbi:hypothetical protein AAFF_G00053990 [Aldrovandia affinis]|uniref:Uncharacterized protein n=1 Tax=Aldrovandia affinis TaxID=143900 RepID=A0AAD7S1A7_9TELE|nr:hypothetical protein AAFF_G00053990 [Aldrovandia affinis]